MLSTLWFHGLLLLFISCASTQGKDEELDVLGVEKGILDEMLNSSKYDSRIRPKGFPNSLSPTEVKVNMYVLQISRIDDTRMQYNLQMFLRQKWTDGRLRFDSMGGKLKFINLFDDKVWTPDLFFASEKTGNINNLMKPNKFTRISSDGGVVFSARVSLVVSCPMQFQWYPFDSQVCTFPMESYGFTNKDVTFEWDGSDPVQMNVKVNFAYYNVQKTEVGYCHMQFTTGNYSCLKYTMYLKRSLQYPMMHQFIPCMMLVITSWIPFWMDHKVIMTRLFPVLSSLLVLVYKVSDINANLPIVPYVKSVDIWTGVCLAFVFAALVELVIVDYRWRSELKKRRRAAGTVDTTEEENGAAFDLKPLVVREDEEDEGSAFHTRTHSSDAGRMRNFFYRWAPKLPTGLKRLDIISRYVFPSCFSLFVVFYFSINLSYYAIQ